ncbi:hypothetical protein D9Q98_004191 [Chlorella vulgaris]|uniref:PUM-HD domain-containing protein n=1 Tax=Chlorella vulgaris TaxID=3077 RepID=A0A9D4TRV5_CHLVU|nr:hypothetical protein D9Q98_004191 [Chlorella vulgaris]
MLPPLRTGVMAQLKGAAAKKRPAARETDGKKRPAAASQGGSQPAKRQKASSHYESKHEPTKPVVQLNRKERKELDKVRKARRNKNFGLIEEAKVLWEEARRSDISPEKRSKLITAILGKVQGRLAELAGSHSASRIIQSCAKYGSPAERAAIVKELEPKLLELSKSPYGHFVVSKLVSLAPKEQLPGLLKAFRGHLGALLRHPAGCHVVDDLYAVANAKQRNLMAAEFYGKEYVLFENGTLNNTQGVPAHLGDLMPHVDGGKQRSIIQHMSKDLIPIMEKGLVDCPLVHRLISEFMEFSPASVVADGAENLLGDPLLHMVHTKEGVKAVCMALAYGTAKDRKKALKSMKGHVGSMARDEWGHLALITALSVVDDTTLLRKLVVSELQSNLAELVEHKYGYRVLIQVLHPYCGRYLPPQLLAIARPPGKEYSAAAMQRQPQGGVQPAAKSDDAEAVAGSDDDEQAEAANARPTSGPLGVSKKQPDLRRRELLSSGGASSLAAALVALCAEQAAQLIRSQHGSDILVEVCRGGKGGLLEECLEDAAALGAVHDALVAAVADRNGSGSEEEAEGVQAKQKEPVLSHFFGSRALRRLVLASSAEDASGAAAAAFCSKLWHGALLGHCGEWVGTHAAKVVAALLQCGDEEVKAAVATELKPLALPGGSLEEWATQLTSGGAAAKKQAPVKKQVKKKKK